MTFENNNINYQLEIKNIRSFLGKADTLEKYNNLIENTTMLFLNTDDNNKYKDSIRILIDEIEMRKEMD